MCPPSIHTLPSIHDVNYKMKRVIMSKQKNPKIYVLDTLLAAVIRIMLKVDISNAANNINLLIAHN
jgi:hypothetical protein